MKKNHKILLVDDDTDFVEGIKIPLEANGFDVVTAFDGHVGLQKARETVPDLIILDVMLPSRDGFSVCHELKSDDATAHIPIMMLTSLGNRKEGKTAAEIMARGHTAELFVEKPIEPDLLVSKANELIKKAGKMAEGQQRIKVLLVDDDPDFIAAVKTILESHNFSVKTCYTGEDGLVAARSVNPDIILLDVMLPGKDGYAVCKELKEDEKTKMIPVVMLTSVGEKLTEPDYAKAIAVTHKADDYIEKPIEAKILMQHIRKLTGPVRRLV